MRAVRICIIFCILITAATACRPQRSAVIVPTLARLPSTYLLDDAERVARDFTTAWGRDDRATMHRLLSFAAQDAYPRDAFDALHDQIDSALGAEALRIDPITVFRQQDSIAIFSYDLTWTTRLFGEVSERARQLTVIVDDRAADWRIAWTPAVLFPELATGAFPRLITTIPNRANIYDRDGRALADQTRRLIDLIVVANRIPDYDRCLAALARALDEPIADVRARLEARPVDWRVTLGTISAEGWTTHNAALDTTCRAEYEQRPARRYDAGAASAHLLGSVGVPDPSQVPTLEALGFNAASIVGRSGIEGAWDSTLRGTPGARLVLVNSAGAIAREIASAPPQAGESVWLTIDADLQDRVYAILEEAYLLGSGGWAAASAGAAVVIMDVRTGDIRALVSYPSFDNNAYLPAPPMGRAAADAQIRADNANPRRPTLNRTTQGLYPLGSVMKTVSAAAAGESGVYELNQRYTCFGTWNRDILRYDWTPAGHGVVTLTTSITQSCNPFYYEVGYQLDQVDPYLLPGYMRRLGFGAPTGLPDIPEAGGLIADPDWLRRTTGEAWRFSEAVNLAIGQGYLQVTPLQVARWTGAIANGGDLLTPHLVERVGLIGDNPRPAYTPERTPTGLSPEVIAVLRNGMCAVTTTQFGTATFVFQGSPLQTIGVCGKTGTAQTGQPGQAPHAWFAAYAPRETPEIAIAVIVETSGDGSAIAAPITRSILEYYFGFVP